MTALTPAELAAADRALRTVLRNDFCAFVEKTFQTVCPGQTFWPNWHLQAICNALQRVAAGEIKRLIILVPPRSLKSICASVALPAWFLGNDATRRIICVSYSADLAAKHARDCRAVMTAPSYQGVFPSTRLDPTKLAETEFMTTQRGFRLATSTGGTLTGRGGNIIIIDDPLKPADAHSDARRLDLQQVVQQHPCLAASMTRSMALSWLSCSACTSTIWLATSWIRRAGRCCRCPRLPTGSRGCRSGPARFITAG